MINPIENIQVKCSIYNKIQFELDKIAISFMSNKQQN